jgi:hypothetical protein
MLNRRDLLKTGGLAAGAISIGAMSLSKARGQDTLPTVHRSQRERLYVRGHRLRPDQWRAGASSVWIPGVQRMLDSSGSGTRGLRVITQWR